MPLAKWVIKHAGISGSSRYQYITHENSPPMIIREFNNDDLPMIKMLLADLSGHELTNDDVLDRFAMIRKSKIDELFVGLIDGEIVGLLAFRIRENIEEVSRYGEISAIIVDKNFRNKGIGNNLIEFAEDYAKTLNCKGTWLVSGFGREEYAHKFYVSKGYKTTGYRFVKNFD